MWFMCFEFFSLTCARAYVSIQKKIQNSVDKLVDLLDKQQQNGEKVQEIVDQDFGPRRGLMTPLNGTPLSFVDFGECASHGMGNIHTVGLVGLGGLAHRSGGLVFQGHSVSAQTYQRALEASARNR